MNKPYTYSEMAKNSEIILKMKSKSQKDKKP